MNACIKDAIAIAETGACGYTYPVIDQDKCVDCGLCAKICPANNPVALNAPLKAFAAISKDLDDLMSSNSGAASSVMVNHILANEGIAYGCVQENYCDIAHRRIDRQSDAYKIKGSKYVQSNIGFIYREVKRDLNNGRTVLFTGTPCQIAGLRNYLRKDYANLYLIDLVCHGVPPQKLLQDNVKKTLKENNITEDRAKVVFRKTIKGKSTYCLHLHNKENKEIPLPEKYTSLLENDYITGFLSEIILRENCFSCPYAQSKRNSDITIADFWGLPQCSIPQDKGISLMLANTEKGLQLINAISHMVHIEERPISEAIKGNGRLQRPGIMPKNKQSFEELYAKDPEKAYRKYLYYFKKKKKLNQRQAQIKRLINKNKTIKFIFNLLYKLIKQR